MTEQHGREHVHVTYRMGDGREAQTMPCIEEAIWSVTTGTVDCWPAWIGGPARSSGTCWHHGGGREHARVFHSLRSRPWRWSRPERVHDLCAIWSVV